MLAKSIAKSIRIWIILFGTLGLITVGACKEKKTKSPAPQKAPQDETKIQPDDDQRNADDQTPDERTDAPEIVLPSGTSANDLEYNSNETVRLKLGLDGIDNNSNYEFGLLNPPTGAQLLGQNTDEPELVWSPASSGNYDITVVARDMALCKEVLSNANDCEFNANNIQVDSRFDVLKDLSFKIGTGSPGGNGYNGAGNSGDQCNDQGGGGFFDSIGDGISDFFSGIFGGGLGDFFGGDDDCGNGAGSGGSFGGNNDNGYGGGGGGW